MKFPAKRPICGKGAPHAGKLPLKNQLKNCGWLSSIAALNIIFYVFWKITVVKCLFCLHLIPVKTCLPLSRTASCFNGPGDPAALPYIVNAARAVIDQIPVFGICLGHQIIGQAIGGKRLANLNSVITALINR